MSFGRFIQISPQIVVTKGASFKAILDSNIQLFVYFWWTLYFLWHKSWHRLVIFGEFPIESLILVKEA